MSAAPKYPEGVGYAGMRMTADEYLSLGETHERYELIDGVVTMSPSPSYRHNRVLRFMVKAVEECADRIPGLDLVFETDIEFSGDVVYCPDLAVYAPGRLPRDASRVSVVPDLVVEVLSPGSRGLDLKNKRDGYERFGVGEYWVVEQSGISARVWRRVDNRFVEAEVTSTVLNCASIPGVLIDLARLRGFVDGE
jgi:Uma2 family endonuclease